MKRLIIMRHGKSDWQNQLDDFHRPLKRRGKDAAARVGKWLADNNLIPDILVTSPAERAYNTAKICSRAMNFKNEVLTDKRLYLASIEDIIEVLSEHWEQYENLMIVGHNPGLEEFLLKLAGNNIAPREDGKVLTTASFAVFAFNQMGEQRFQHADEFVCHFRPDQLTS